MPRSCSIPNCVNKNYAEIRKKNASSKYQKTSGIQKLAKQQFVCEDHFEEKYIIINFIKYNENNEAIYKAPLPYPHLCKGSIPTIFPQSTSEDTDLDYGTNDHDHTYLLLSKRRKVSHNCNNRIFTDLLPNCEEKIQISSINVPDAKLQSNIILPQPDREQSDCPSSIIMQMQQKAYGLQQLLRTITKTQEIEPQLLENENATHPNMNYFQKDILVSKYLKIKFIIHVLNAQMLLRTAK